MERDKPLKTNLPLNHSFFGSGLILKNRFSDTRIFLRITAHPFQNTRKLRIFSPTGPGLRSKKRLNIAYWTRVLCFFWA